MSTVLVKTRYTPEDLLTMPDGERYELVDGNLVERDMGQLSSWVGGQIFGLVREFTREHDLGWTFPADCSYQCFPDAPNKVRKPDASFIRRGRLAGEQLHEGHVRIAPDLAAEVVSSNDLFYEVETKVAEYLEAGVRLVWVVNPGTRTVQVYRADGTVSRLRESDELTGEDVLPGFRCPVKDLFPPATQPVAAQ